MVNWMTEYKMICEPRWKIGMLGFTYLFMFGVTLLLLPNLTQMIGMRLCIIAGLVMTLVAQLLLLMLTDNINTALILLGLLGIGSACESVGLVYLMGFSKREDGLRIMVPLLIL